MRVVLLIAVLAVLDGGLMGFRAAAGRFGKLDKRAYYRAAIARGMLAAAALVCAHGVLAAALAAASGDFDATLGSFVEAARPVAYAFGAFASVALAAFAFYFAPVGDFRVLANVVVLGPFTIARPWVIAGGCGYAAWASHDARVALLAISASTTMLAAERWLARRYTSLWRELLSAGAPDAATQ